MVNQLVSQSAFCTKDALKTAGGRLTWVLILHTMVILNSLKSYGFTGIVYPKYLHFLVSSVQAVEAIFFKVIGKCS